MILARSSSRKRGATLAFFGQTKVVNPSPRPLSSSFSCRLGRVFVPEASGGLRAYPDAPTLADDLRGVVSGIPIIGNTR